MTHPIIEARDLGKRYSLRSRGRDTFRDVIVDAAQAPARWFRGEVRTSQTEFWALRHVTLNVARGDAVGIIGRNGAGKSTLLKILSRITSPSTGEVRLRGKVASLLEVGSGFHGELSGRENIFLNGAIMGMTRAEVRARFDEIVAFAEVDQFLDVPVKRYSSGMYVRLAFAVAAHLQPDILIVDEVLAVGDGAFQRKCLGKMQTVASGGRTVLFVSHNMAAISRLCSQCVLLQNGEVAAEGPVATVIATYASGIGGESLTAVDFASRRRRPGSDCAEILAARLVGLDQITGSVDIRRELRVEIDYVVLASRYAIHPNIQVHNGDSVCLFVSQDSIDSTTRRARPAGRYRSELRIPGNFLSEGMHTVDVALTTNEPDIVHAWERGALMFLVVDPAQGDSVRGNYAGSYPGVVRPHLPWVTRPLA